MEPSLIEYLKENIERYFREKGEPGKPNLRDYTQLDVGITKGKIGGKGRLFCVILKPRYSAPTTEKHEFYCKIAELRKAIRFIAKKSVELKFSTRYCLNGKSLLVYLKAKGIRRFIREGYSDQDFEIYNDKYFSNFFQPNIWQDFMASLKEDINPDEIKAMYPKFKKKKGDRPFTIGGPAL